MSFGGKVRPVDELIENLIKVINWTKRICNTPFEEPTDIPLLLSKSSQLKKQKAKFCEKAKQQKERDLQPPPCKKYCSMPKRKKTNKKQMKSKIQGLCSIWLIGIAVKHTGSKIFVSG